ncbi:unnamed protein product [Ectocarpus sp. CCAP 1310/34]|nr:unnamed protein product [Ectocarpus sp. CCAP 1310/34]
MIGLAVGIVSMPVLREPGSWQHSRQVFRLAHGGQGCELDGKIGMSHALASCPP